MSSEDYTCVRSGIDERLATDTVNSVLPLLNPYASCFKGGTVFGIYRSSIMGSVAKIDLR